MRKFIICGLALGLIAIVSATIRVSAHKSIAVAAIDSIDHAKLTLAAGVLPVEQVDEPF